MYMCCVITFVHPSTVCLSVYLSFNQSVYPCSPFPKCVSPLALRKNMSAVPPAGALAWSGGAGQRDGRAHLGRRRQGHSLTPEPKSYRLEVKTAQASAVHSRSVGGGNACSPFPLARSGETPAVRLLCHSLSRVRLRQAPNQSYVRPTCFWNTTDLFRRIRYAKDALKASVGDKGTEGLPLLSFSRPRILPFAPFPLLYFSDWFLGLHRQIHKSFTSSPVIDVIHCATCLSSPRHPSSWLIIVSAPPPSLSLSSSPTPYLRCPADRCGSRANTAPCVIVRSQKIRYF